MSTKSKNNGQLTLVSLVLMIFTSVFGFANMPRSFYLMGMVQYRGTYCQQLRFSFHLPL